VSDNIVIDDEGAVREVEAAYDRAWRAGDIGALTSCLTEDVVLVTPRDEVVVGRDDARRFFTAFLDGPARGSQHATRILRVNFITADVAIVDGEAVIEGVQESEFGALTVVHRFTDVLRRGNGQWAIAHIRAYAMSTRAQTDVK
jgi:uncharacterized protein (TIGR02246 family)